MINYTCDRCGTAMENQQITTIDAREYELCDKCEGEILEPLTGKGRVVAPVTTFVPYPVYPVSPGPSYPQRPIYTWTTTGVTGTNDLVFRLPGNRGPVLNLGGCSG